MLEGDTLETLAVTGVGEYKVSVKVDEKTLSRIVTFPLKVQELTGLKMGTRTISDKKSNGSAANLKGRKNAARFDAQGRALKKQANFQKAFRKN